LNYRERIFPSLGATASFSALILALAFSVWAALGVMAALIPTVPALIALLFWWRNAIHEISWDGALLKVNQAKIEASYFSRVEVLENEQWRLQIGREFDPAAFNSYRFWMKSGLRLTINDPRDPHRIWIIGSRNPIKLAALIQNSL
jgi:hypothetical protein